MTLSELKFGEIRMDTITWVEVITESVKMNAIAIIVKDSLGTAISLSLYNQFETTTDFNQL